MKRLFLILALVFAAGLAHAQFRTSLTLTVRDELGNTAEEVNVKLFENEADYNAEKNAAQEGTTNEKGEVKFKDLKAIAYYVLARKGDKDNTGAGEKIGKLEEKRLNKATIIIQ